MIYAMDNIDYFIFNIHIKELYHISIQLLIIYYFNLIYKITLYLKRN